MRRLVAILACGLGFTAACGTGGGGHDQTHAHVHAEIHAGAACAMAVRFHGHLYWGRTVAERLQFGGALGNGVIPACQDNEGASSDQPIHIRAIRGIDVRTAVADADQPRVIYLYDPKARLPTGITAARRSP